MLMLSIKSTTMQDDKFIVRAYGFGELAQLYFPHVTKKSASTQFGRWIRLNESLKNQLLQNGFNLGNRILTPKQVAVLIHCLGEP